MHIQTFGQFPAINFKPERLANGDNAKIPHNRTPIVQ
jgi:hypothetical protein